MEEKSKPRIHIGTIGHVNANKTTLQEAIEKYLAAHGKAGRTDEPIDKAGTGISIKP